MKTKPNKTDCVLILALALAVALTPVASLGQQCGRLQQQVLRLHILADSDNENDQRIKLAVRDAVLRGTQGMFAAAETPEQARELAAQNLEAIEELAGEELARQGSSCEVHAELTEMYFGSRAYNNATLPAGRYEALRLTIGRGKGRNWWCVVFPPLCIESAAKEEGEDALTQEVEGLDTRPDYKLAFASVELFEAVREQLRGKV